MALTFDGTSGYLKLVGAIASAMPLTMFAYGKFTGSGSKYLMGTGKANAGDPVYCALSRVTGSAFPASNHRTPGSSRVATGNVVVPSASFSPYSGSFLSTGTYLYQGAAATQFSETTARTDSLSTHDQFVVGGSGSVAAPTSSELWAGDIAEIALWSSDLSSGDRTTLHGGALPETVSSGTLIDVWDLKTLSGDGNYVGRINGHVLVASGGVTQSAATHPITRTASTSVSSDLAATYAVASSVSFDLTATYSIGAAGSVSSDLGATYQVIAAVSSDCAAAYQLMGTVSSSLAATYNILSMGTITPTQDFGNNTGSLYYTNEAVTVFVHTLSTNALVATKSLTTDSAAMLAGFSDAAFVSGTSYRCIFVFASGPEGMETLAAT